jgi:two-component system, response regulator
VEGPIVMCTGVADILLIEDNPHDVALAMHAFRRHRIANNIHVARDGAEALDYLFCRGDYEDRRIEDVPRLILLDLKLPRVSGIEVLRATKADPRTQAIPVVVLTTSREDRDVLSSYELGVNSYIVKPVDFHQFCDAVRDLGLYWLLLNQAPRVS